MIPIKAPSEDVDVVQSSTGQSVSVPADLVDAVKAGRS